MITFVSTKWLHLSLRNDYIWVYWQVDMYAGTIFIQQAIGLDLYAGVVILLAISAVYTVSGSISLFRKKSFLCEYQYWKINRFPKLELIFPYFCISIFLPSLSSSQNKFKTKQSQYF